MHPRIALVLAPCLTLATAYGAVAGSGWLMDRPGPAQVVSAGDFQVAVISLDGSATQVDSKHVICAPIHVVSSSGSAPSCRFMVVSFGKIRPSSMTVSARVEGRSPRMELGRFRIGRVGERSWTLDSLPQAVGSAHPLCFVIPSVFAYTMSWSGLTNASLGGWVRIDLDIRATG